MPVMQPTAGGGGRGWNGVVVVDVVFVVGGVGVASVQNRVLTHVYMRESVSAGEMRWEGLGGLGGRTTQRTSLGRTLHHPMDDALCYARSHTIRQVT